jgi:hypothetical protein
MMVQIMLCVVVVLMCELTAVPHKRDAEDRRPYVAVI